MKNIVCIVQARMTSTRLPGKVMLNLGGQTVIGQVFSQLSYSELIAKIVLATSDQPEDNALEEWAQKNNKLYYRGSLDNVLERYYYTARQYDADIIVRITADCPLIDPALVDSVIDGFMKGGYDYYSNVNPPTFPDGLDTEVFNFAVLEYMHKKASLNLEKEHVTYFISRHPEIFNTGNYSSEINYEKYRLTLDNYDDYKLIKNIYDHLYEEGKFIHWLKVIKYIENNPDLITINSNYKRNEGFFKTSKKNVE